MKKILSIFAGIAILASCAKTAEFVSITELGCEYPQASVSFDGGSAAFKVICTSDALAEIIQGEDWISFEGNALKSISFNSDAVITLNCAPNEGRERKAVVKVSAGNRSLELTVLQDGKESSSFTFPDHNVLVGFETASHSVKFTSDVAEDQISYSVTYENGEGWIEEPLPGVKGGSLVFAVRENLASQRRGAIITLSSKDKVGRDLVARLYVSQMAYGEVETIPVTVQDVRNFTVEDLDGENRIRKNYVLKARVINDDIEGNGAPNRNISIIVQDLELSSRTLYLQSLEPDGNGQYCGIQLQFKTPEDNSASRFDLIEINLKGLKFKAVGQKGGKIPFHVILSEAGVVNIVSSQGGTLSDLPVIKRKINELTDDDIATFVSIDNCEIPFRKGPFCPLDLRYLNIINKYPMAIRDIDGNIMYLMNNTTCAWARDGQGMPEGAGTVSGVIVHEACDNYEWDTQAAKQSPLLSDYVTDVGYIGKYQIRPLHKEDIAFSRNLDDGVSKLITEFRYANANYPDKLIVNMQNDTIYPTYPAVLEPVKNPELNGYVIYSGGSFSISYDWTHLGPVVNGKITDLPGNNGVFDAIGRPLHWNMISYCQTCAIITEKNGTAWHSGTWTGLRDNYWEIGLSTEGLTAANAPLSINLGLSSGKGDDLGAPRYWMVAYSTDKQNWKTVTAADYESESWVDLTAKGTDYTYTIPDFPMVSSKRQYNLPGNKWVSVNLPSSADVWGKSHLYIHLYPASDISGDGPVVGGVSYDEGKIHSSRRSCLNYVGIRCKK